jgi:hypothetical protein
VSHGILSISHLEDNNFPHLSDSNLGDNTLEVILESVILTYMEPLSPIPLPTYLGRSALQPLASGEASEHFSNLNSGLGKYYTWSKGLGYETHR